MRELQCRFPTNSDCILIKIASDVNRFMRKCPLAPFAIKALSSVTSFDANVTVRRVLEPFLGFLRFQADNRKPRRYPSMVMHRTFDQNLLSLTGIRGKSLDKVFP